MIVETERSIGKNYLYLQTDENLTFNGHIHNSYEFITVTKGQLECCIYDKKFTLERGKALLIMPNHVHRYETAVHSKSFLCVFSPDYVGDFFNDIDSQGFVYSFFDYTDGGGIEALNSKKLNRYGIRSVLYGICAQAYNSLKRAESTGEKDAYIFEKRLIEYIRKNYQDGISLKKMSIELGYNYSYLSGMFNKTFGCGFMKFVNRLKLEDAAELLRTEDLSVAEVCSYCGFNNIRTLNAQFREEYGTTPTEYRKRKRANAVKSVTSGEVID